MSTTSSASFLAPGLRLLGAAAALCTTSAIAAALLAGWQHAADPVWLAATPEVLADVAACDAELSRAERERCKQCIVAARAPSETRSYPMASR